jgi:asparagine synthase (glutamine-hydrolysing)
MSYVDLKSFLPNNLLHYTDRMSMAHALEVRVPFCDHRLVEFMASIPFAQKMPHFSPKRLLKDAVTDLLPESILNRKKLGFNPPMGIWLNRDLAPLVDEHLDPARLKREGYFDAGFVGRMVREHRLGQRDYSLHLWALLVFQSWLGIFQT